MTRANGADVVKWSERLLLDRLRARYSKVTGNGPEWAYMEHVRDGAGFDAGSTIDALALHLWPSRNHEAHAFEVKCSRADFRRELADDQAKSAPWRARVEFFWIVAPLGVLVASEIPEEWGLLLTKGDGLRVAKPASRLRPRPSGYTPEADLPRGLVAAMLRAQVRNARKVNGFWTAPAEDVVA